HENEKILIVERWDGADRILLIANLDTMAQTAPIDVASGTWRKLIDSAEEKWRGPGTSLNNELDGRAGGRMKLAPRSLGLFHCQRTSL
ncbi:MAG TPA: alpha amylase C-terminal domain-containing protein, partial [Phototrophicaceae bacterium]|nr:alpha amylase C-terminal domain-containing protein [Phototrophicaceae bacterium]